MSALKDLKLFATHPHPCSYLEGQRAKTLFIDPELVITREQHSRLSEIGFRRSGNHLYRPYCDDCQACIPCRVPVHEFQPNRRFRRILKRNSDLRVEAVENIESQEYFSLYSHYINTRHQDGDMFPATWEQYQSFLASGCEGTRYYAIRDQADQLLGLMVCDHLDHALSAVYTCFDPRQPKRSLGTYAILWQIEESKRLNLPYLYLGYWIRNCQKMEYKSEFRPLELFLNSRWSKLN